MRSLIFILLLGFVLGSCQLSNYTYEDIDSVQIRINDKQKINSGQTIEYVPQLVLRDGSIKTIKNDSLVKLDSTVLEDVGKHKAKILATIPDFESVNLPTGVRFELGELVIESIDTIQFNFKGSIEAELNGNDGGNGLSPRASVATLFSRNGLVGRNGGNGIDGQNAPSYTGYLWLEAEELRLIMISDTGNLVFNYRSLNKEAITFNLSGGKGGHGGKGGDGGNGKDASGSKAAGNGANGGNGGNGGDGGNGGSLLLFLHPNASHLNKSIELINLGGAPGEAGEMGLPGDGGKDSNGVVIGSKGNLGLNGTPGQPGIDGPPATISVVGFVPSKIFAK